MKFLTKINVFTPGKLFWVGTMLATKQIIKIVDPNTEDKTLYQGSVQHWDDEVTCRAPLYYISIFGMRSAQSNHSHGILSCDRLLNCDQ